MVLYKCRRCGYGVDHKHNYIKHLNRKNVCKPVLENISIETLRNEFSNSVNVCVNPSVNIVNPSVNTVNISEPSVNVCVNPSVNTVNISDENVTNSSIDDNNYACIYCNKIFTYRQSRYRHQKTCKKKDISLDNNLSLIKNYNENYVKNHKDIIIEKLQHQLEVQSQHLTKALDNGGTINNNTINNIENQQINIQINGFGKEVTDYITPEYIQGLFNGPYGAVPKLLEQIHFHPDHPENWNVKISNDKKPHVQIYDESKEKWVKRDKKEAIVDMVEKGYNMLDDHFSKSQERNILDGKVVEKYSSFQQKYDSLDKGLHKDLNKTTHLLIMNEGL